MQQVLLPLLGDQCTEEVEQAWIEFLNYIVHIMSEGMYM